VLARAENMVTVPGTSSIAHLEENVASAAVRLSSEQVAELNTLAD
jgi:pyridoxine 4-dehydrogenase